MTPIAVNAMTQAMADAAYMAAAPVPATVSSPGAAKQMSFDANYLYVCIAANTWRRIPLEGW